MDTTWFDLMKIGKREDKIDPCGAPKKLKKIKLEDVIAILTLSLFLDEVINILHKI